MSCAPRELFRWELLTSWAKKVTAIFQWAWNYKLFWVLAVLDWANQQAEKRRALNWCWASMSWSDSNRLVSLFICPSNDGFREISKRVFIWWRGFQNKLKSGMTHRISIIKGGPLMVLIPLQLIRIRKYGNSKKDNAYLTSSYENSGSLTKGGRFVCR